MITSKSKSKSESNSRSQSVVKMADPSELNSLLKVRNEAMNKIAAYSRDKRNAEEQISAILAKNNMFDFFTVNYRKLFNYFER